ncbi:MAG: exodeoxyribonuclease VII large subunit [bacterium]
MNRMAAESERARVFTVTELTRQLRSVVEGQFGAVGVEGELSNVRQPPSGHCYFTIKDEAAQIRAVIWRSDMRGLPFIPKDGIKVRAHGSLTVYERDGSYQIVVKRMEEAGKGSLQAAFEALKKKLAAEGLFEAARKRRLPLLPRHIGVVTSPTGAAIRDILNVLGRRFPNLHVVLAPARVQGDGAAQEIADAIDLLNRHGGLEVMIVGRGGGSLEDLWCFNEEIVARAVARSEIPVISAVGHETDFTICDFVADVRAPTPSAAAEIVVGRKEEFLDALRQHSLAMTRLLQHALLEARSRFHAASRSYVFREPGNAARVYRQRIEGLQTRTRHILERRFRDGQQQADDLSARLSRQLSLTVADRSQRIRSLERQLAAYNPLAVLKRGYSITFNAEGRAIRSAAEVAPGVRVRTRVGEGNFTSQVIHEQKKD